MAGGRAAGRAADDPTRPTGDDDRPSDAGDDPPRRDADADDGRAADDEPRAGAAASGAGAVAARSGWSAPSRGRGGRRPADGAPRRPAIGSVGVVIARRHPGDHRVRHPGRRSVSTSGPTRSGSGASASTRSSGPASAPGRAVRRRVIALARPPRQPVARRPARAAAERSEVGTARRARRPDRRGVRRRRPPASAAPAGARVAGAGYGGRSASRSVDVRGRGPARPVPLGRSASIVARRDRRPGDRRCGRPAPGRRSCSGVNRVPFAPTGSAPVVDPIFGRDIGFFLFELPFLRLLQARPTASWSPRWSLTLGRYLLAGAARRAVFTTQVRVHLAVLGGLFLLSVALGYQLDKFELVYSTRASRPASASRTRTPSSSPTTC